MRSQVSCPLIRRRLVQEVTAVFRVGDVFDRLAELEDGSIDLVVTSPPFLALRSYLPADHPDKGKEIGSEATPAEFLDTLLLVTAELRRVLAPHGSIAVELGDTYAGSGGAGGDYGEQGLRDGQQKFDGSGRRDRAADVSAGILAPTKRPGPKERDNIAGWPLAKSVSMIPEAYRFALAYGFNPFTGQPSPAGKWRVRNRVTWCRPNPPVGALGDKWRPATSDVVVACVSPKRYWDDLATRKPHQADPTTYTGNGYSKGFPEGIEGNGAMPGNPSGAPLLDYWEIPPGGYQGAHYAVFPPALVEPLVKAMGPQKVCQTCGEPSRRITEMDKTGHELRSISEATELRGSETVAGTLSPQGRVQAPRERAGERTHTTAQVTLGWTDCGHGNYRPGIVLDPFAGSGTTLAVATGHGLDAIGIDLDERNADLAMERVGPLLLEVTR